MAMPNEQLTRIVKYLNSNGRWELKGSTSALKSKETRIEILKNTGKR